MFCPCVCPAFEHSTTTSVQADVDGWRPLGWGRRARSLGRLAAMGRERKFARRASDQQLMSVPPSGPSLAVVQHVWQGCSQGRFGEEGRPGRQEGAGRRSGVAAQEEKDRRRAQGQADRAEGQSRRSDTWREEDAAWCASGAAADGLLVSCLLASAAPSLPLLAPSSALALLFGPGIGLLDWITSTTPPLHHHRLLLLLIDATHAAPSSPSPRRCLRRLRSPSLPSGR